MCFKPTYIHSAFRCYRVCNVLGIIIQGSKTLRKPGNKYYKMILYDKKKYHQ